MFNISGNRYRLITYIDYEYKMVFIRSVLTHAEYRSRMKQNIKPLKHKFTKY